MRLYDNDAYREEFMELVYSLLQSDDTNDRANQIIAAFDNAPEVEAEPLTPNDPLTLEELRKMQGEPVYVKSAFGYMYAIVGDTSRKRLLLHGINTRKGDSHEIFDFEAFHKIGALGAFRRKPEEVL